MSMQRRRASRACRLTQQHHRIAPQPQRPHPLPRQPQDCQQRLCLAPVQEIQLSKTRLRLPHRQDLVHLAPRVPGDKGIRRPRPAGFYCPRFVAPRQVVLPCQRCPAPQVQVQLRHILVPPTVHQHPVTPQALAGRSLLQRP